MKRGISLMLSIALSVYPLLGQANQSNWGAVRTGNSLIDATAFLGSDPLNTVSVAASASGGNATIFAQGVTGGTVSNSVTLSQSNLQIYFGEQTYTLASGKQFILSGVNQDIECTPGGNVDNLGGTVFDGSTVNAGSSSNNAPFLISGGDTITVKGCGVKGNYLGQGGSNTPVVGGDGTNAHFGAPCFSIQSTPHVDFEHNGAYLCGQYGLAVNNSDYPTIAWNSFKVTTRACINLNSSGGTNGVKPVIVHNRCINTQTWTDIGNYDINVTSSGGVNGVNDAYIAYNFSTAGSGNWFNGFTGACSANFVTATSFTGSTPIAGQATMTTSSAMGLSGGATVGISGPAAFSGIYTVVSDVGTSLVVTTNTGTTAGTNFVGIAPTVNDTGHCTGGIQVNGNESTVDVTDNTLENYLHECIPITNSGTVLVAHNLMAACGVSNAGTPSAGAGCMTIFLPGTTSSGATVINGDDTYIGNLCMDSGYLFGALLGAGANTDGNWIRGLTVVDNHIFNDASGAFTSPRGLEFTNNSGASACSGRKCQWGVKGAWFANNDVAQASTPFFWDKSQLTSFNAYVTCPNGCPVSASGSLAAVGISSISSNGATITMVTSTPLNVALPGTSQYTIAGTTNYNGTFTIASATESTKTYTITSTLNVATENTGTATTIPTFNSSSFEDGGSLFTGGNLLTSSKSSTTTSLTDAGVQEQAYVLTGSAYTNATNSYTNVSPFAFPVVAGHNYKIDCSGLYKGAATGGLIISATGPASPTQDANFLWETGTSGAAALPFISVNLNTDLGAAVTTANTDMPFIYNINVTPSAAGTIQIRAKAAATVANGLTIEVGMMCVVR